MKLIIGIGNPGSKYKNNRHNIGYKVADELKAQSLKLKDVIVAKTNKFMNESGIAVKKLANDYRLVPSALFVVHDDLDIKLGEYKIQLGKGPKDHKGLNSIYEELGTKDFWHVRVGVDNRDPNNRISGEEYVLEDFTNEENEVVRKTIGKLVDDLISNKGRSQRANP
jgi:PTH1 family peptidyl-tRNA hydrolase